MFRNSARVVLVLLSLCGPSLAATVTIDPNTRYQFIEGWGACPAGWYAGEPYYQDDWRIAFRDLGCNILRLPMVKEVLIAPDGNYATPVTLADDVQTNVNLMDFTGSGLPEYMALATWLTQNAYEPCEVKVVPDIWSPPHWMKGPTGYSQYFVGDPTQTPYPTPWLEGCGGTCGSSIGGRLLQTSYNLEQFGRFVTAWVTGFEQAAGFPVYAVSLQNESAFENPFDSCTYTTGPNKESGQYWQYASALKAVKDEFQQKDVHVKIHGPHHASLGDSPASPWSINIQTGFIKAVKDHSDPNLINFLDFYGSNGYQPWDEGGVKCWAAYWLGKDSVPGPWAAWAYVPGISNDGKRVWFAEGGGPSAPWLNGAGGTVGDGAIVVAQVLHSAMVHANASSYVYWQFCDGSPTETVHTLLGLDNIFTPLNSKKYCAYKHFSRYIRPGAQRIKATFENGKTSIGGATEYDTYNGLNVSAFVKDANGTITLVLVNMKSADQSVTINVPAGPNYIPFDCYRSSSSENFAQLPDVNVVSGQLSLSIPAYSVVTLTSIASGALEPNAASNPYPPYNTQGVSINADLSWTAGFNAVSHDVYFGTDSSPDETEFMGNQAASTFDLPAMLPNTFYYWRIDEKNSYGKTKAGTTWRFKTGTDTGDGLVGQYYDNNDLTNLKLTRIDPTVNFNWGLSSPDLSINPDTFSVRWTGLVQPRYSETCTFYTYTDDGARLWVDGNLLIDKWQNQSPTEWSGSIALNANQLYDIEMQYYQADANALVQLSWSSPSQAKQIIPQGRLFKAYIAGDLNRDFLVNFTDLDMFADQWLTNPDCNDPNCADLNDSGNVDFTDFALMGLNWE